MGKKFELLTGSPRSYYRRTLFQVKALKDFGDIKKGDLGGWVETEDSLSQDGLCWIGPKTILSPESRVSGDAIIFGYIRLLDGAEVKGSAIITGNGYIGDTPVFGDKDQLLEEIQDSQKQESKKVVEKEKVPEPSSKIPKVDIPEEVEEPKAVVMVPEEVSNEDDEDSSGDDFDFLD